MNIIEKIRMKLARRAVRKAESFDDKDIERILKIYALENRHKYGTKEEILEKLKKLLEESGETNQRSALRAMEEQLSQLRPTLRRTCRNLLRFDIC